jgi:hypothetical protein
LFFRPPRKSFHTAPPIFCPIIVGTHSRGLRFVKTVTVLFF